VIWYRLRVWFRDGVDQIRRVVRDDRGRLLSDRFKQRSEFTGPAADWVRAHLTSLAHEVTDTKRAMASRRARWAMRLPLLACGVLFLVGAAYLTRSIVLTDELSYSEPILAFLQVLLPIGLTGSGIGVIGISNSRCSEKGLRRRAAKSLRQVRYWNWILSHQSVLCGACGYPLDRVPRGADGFVECPECWAGWRLRPIFARRRDRKRLD
jgi:hypothetical protein